MLYAFADKSDEHNTDARAIMFRCLKGDFGAPIIVDYCILETLTLLQQRGLSSVVETLLAFIRENKLRIYFVSEQVFNEATRLMIEKIKDRLSLTDCSQVAVSKELNVESIATFDAGLANFFKTCVGVGCFDLLEDKEKHLLQRRK